MSEFDLLDPKRCAAIEPFVNGMNEATFNNEILERAYQVEKEGLILIVEVKQLGNGRSWIKAEATEKGIRSYWEYVKP